MSEQYPSFNRCLRHALWPASHEGAAELIPTGTPEEGCPIGVRNGTTGEWEPVRKLQSQHNY
ncbi:MAG: hypothetical protein HOM68_14475 [Gemmatimonadetes bacterium]|jgi:hypothetical protein|nr:hypothetical protein [Gemmatimonadota bacterium]MBT4608850.1 hypothetical protein [Gemmatimonadota bacterium]MBT5057746.1 hypothetical protein [Gemmatimonadota bacterium]MBT5141342.1 hypothetical protein [Gemmatimonadota bacterium]MBT5590423.1 hypothetical protein [Gemmatimonadota bacterium]